MALTKVAIVEDDLAIVKMYKFKLELEGFDVRTALNGQEGLEMIDQFRPELILLDLKMPIMNGEAMLERLRSHDWGAPIHVVVLTNISKDEAPSGLRFLNVDRYIVKAHHTPKQVVDTIREILKTGL